MSKSKTTKPELMMRLEKALRENLKKRKNQQRERKNSEANHDCKEAANDAQSKRKPELNDH